MTLSIANSSPFFSNLTSRNWARGSLLAPQPHSISTSVPLPATTNTTKQRSRKTWVTFCDKKLVRRRKKQKSEASKIDQVIVREKVQNAQIWGKSLLYWDLEFGFQFLKFRQKEAGVKPLSKKNI